MRIAEIEFIKALSPTQVSSIILLLEKGIELHKLEYIATCEEQMRADISDGCALLSFLYFRQLGKTA
jgi:hypothetical protein